MQLLKTIPVNVPPRSIHISHCPFARSTSPLSHEPKPVSSLGSRSPLLLRHNAKGAPCLLCRQSWQKARCIHYMVTFDTLYFSKNATSLTLCVSREDCREQVHRYPRAVYKKMKTLDEAEGWIKEDGSSLPTPTPTPIAGLGSESLPIAGRSNAPLSARAGLSKPTSSSSSTGFGNVVYTDGACPGNGQPGSVAGIGVWWGPSDPRCVFSRSHTGGPIH